METLFGYLKYGVMTFALGFVVRKVVSAAFALMIIVLAAGG